MHQTDAQLSSLPAHIIFGFQSELGAFAQRVGVPLREMDLAPLMNAIVARMFSEDAVESAIQEFVSGADLSDFSIAHVPTELLAQAVTELAEGLYSIFMGYGCYSLGGVLYYAFDRFLGFDVILRRVSASELRV